MTINKWYLIYIVLLIIGMLLMYYVGYKEGVTQYKDTLDYCISVLNESVNFAVTLTSYIK